MNRDDCMIYEAYRDAHPVYADTTWQDEFNGKMVTVTMQDIEAFLNDHKLPEHTPHPIPVSDIAHLDIHTKNKAKKTPEEQKATYDRAMKSDLRYPIIISMKDGKYNMILDGNHRLHKAIETGEETINARVLDLSKTSPAWQHIFR